MKKIARSLTVILLAVQLYTPLTSFAILDPHDSFDPNFILTDVELNEANSLTRADIQIFLKQHGSFLAEYSANDASGTIRQAADIIFDAAINYHISPKYILVKLQKEQSLITDSNPSARQLDWATGYGVCDSCSTTDPSMQKFRGFGTQVDKAAGIMRWYYDHAQTSSFIKQAGKTYSIDGKTVIPANLATAFLYTYTPHIHGNLNFWRLWKTWFDQVYPNGSLLRGQSSKTIYLVHDGKKRPIANMTALVTRFDPKQIVVVPDTDLNRYALGRPISLPNYSILSDGTQFYLLDDDTLRPFASREVVRQFGYNPDEIISIAKSDISEFPLGASIATDEQTPLGRMVRLNETHDLYYLKEGIYHALPDAAIAAVNFPHMTIESAPATILQDFQPGNILIFRDGTLIGNALNKKVYVIDQGKKRYIPTKEVFSNLGYSSANIIWTNEITIVSIQNGPSMIKRQEFNPADIDTRNTDSEILTSTEITARRKSR